MGGATSIVGSGGQAGLLRNLDQANNQEDLGKKEVEFQTFPLDDSGRGETRRIGDCAYGTSPDTPSKPSVEAADAYEPHTSEGIDTTARNEFLCESSTTFGGGTSNNLLMTKTAMIHAIGLQPADYGAMAAAGTSLIWSPRSNITLYGETARVTTAARLGVRIALGTDWLPTGSMSLLRELACADSFNATYLDHFFRDDQLWMMVTANAAAVTATSDVIGVLDTGKVADIAIFASHGKQPFRSVIEAEPKDVALVMRGGKVLYGDDAVVSAFAQSCDQVDVCGTGKRVCLMDEVQKSFADLQTGATPKSGTLYPAFACGAPPSEPSCTPTRPVSVSGSTIYTGTPSGSDGDGDGIPDESDNCPKVFNPVRPIDGGAQGDVDHDGLGDACDPCPFDANTTACTAVSKDDRDHDSSANAGDNCPETTNADQADSDHDGIGDACDLCPLAANLGATVCPTTIYEIKSGATGPHHIVQLTNVLVTGVGSNGFFVQIKDTDSSYVTADNSGLFVFTSTKPAADVQPGVRVTLEGTVEDFNGQTELVVVPAKVQVAQGGPETPPAPVSVTYAELAAGGATAAKLEGVLVALGDASVDAFDVTKGEATLKDAAGNALIFDDFVFALSPVPEKGEKVVSVTGILAFRSAFKLEPRSADDFVFDSPRMQALGPALSFVRVGNSTDTATFPQPLKVTLRRPSHGNTTIALTSSDPTLTVSDLVIPDKATEGTVLVTANAPLLDGTITATLNTQTPPQVLTAHVRVLDTNDDATAVSLSPPTAAIRPLDMVPITATLDLPALADTAVTLTVAPLNAGTLPATVTVPAGQLATTFTFVNQAASGTSITITATATLGGNVKTSTSTLNVTNVATHLVISQVYGGGGNSGATLKNDFIELHNPTSAPISVAGMSVQYASSTGTASWLVTTLPDATIAPGGYFLIQEAAGSGGTMNLPTPDAMGSIAMGAGAGKVALVANATALSGACPATNVIDEVGYGSTNCSESAATPTLSATLAALRVQNGCSDTDNNSRDFSTAAPAPRNGMTAPVLCQ
ncbi:MAG TPA: thrombospondin type 3 repeat-containing protein [Kofleriaceae bacterium]|nr:thrombospondin type 3 repeat-containing protein [Kofleriaceae bacterium]